MATLQTSIHSSPTAPAIILPHLSPTSATTITYSQLRTHIGAFQARLASLGITHADAVSVALPNSYEFVVSFLAIANQRAVAAPLNPAYTQAEFEFYIEDVKAALVIVPRGAVAGDAPAVRAARRFGTAVAEAWWEGGEVQVDVKDVGKSGSRGKREVETARGEDVALVLHTSGTTSRPKVVPLTHINLTTTMKNIQSTYALTPTDRTMLVMPLFHVHGLLCALLGPLHSGGSIILPPKFSATDFWPVFTAHKATWYTAVPTIHQILLSHPVPSPAPQIRFIRSCSSPLSPATFEKLETAFKAPVLEAYAMTEAAHQMTSNPLPPGPRKPGTVGLGQGVDVRIFDSNGDEVAKGSEGEICVRGPNVTKGYLNNEAANQDSFLPGGFFRTGDQGKLDADGYVVITGRIKELINRGGEKISPVEIDNVVMRHPRVSEAVAFAIPDETYGQQVAVAMVVKEGESLDEKELRAWLREKVAAFKLPKKVYFTKIMPKTATGKVQRRIVAEAMLKQDKPKAKL